jgi:hypothetical protein
LFIKEGKSESTLADSVSFISSLIGPFCALENSGWPSHKKEHIEKTYSVMIAELKEKGLAITTPLGYYIYTA